MTAKADLLANAERPPSDRAPASLPAVPDLEPPPGHGYWHGSAHAALRARDEEISRLRAELSALRSHCAALEADVRELSARGRG